MSDKFTDIIINTVDEMMNIFKKSLKDEENHAVILENYGAYIGSLLTSLVSSILVGYVNSFDVTQDKKEGVFKSMMTMIVIKVMDMYTRQINPKQEIH